MSYQPNRRELTPLECYQVYTSVKNHFRNKTYNIQKYGLSPACFTQAQLNKRRDQWFFKKLSELYDDQTQLSILLASNFVFNPNIWIGDLVYKEECRWNYLRMLSVLRALTHYVKEDTKKLLSEKSFVEILDSREDIPYIIKMALSKEINPETVVVYNRIFNLFGHINTSLNGSHRFVWEPIRHRFEKFTNFVLISDIQKLETIKNEVREIIMINANSRKRKQ